MCLFAIRDVLKVTQFVKAVRLRCSSLCSKTLGSKFTRFWCPAASRETLKFLPVDMSWRRRRGYRWLYPALTSALDEGGWSTLRSVDLVRVVFYAHESARAFAETSRLSHGFLRASKKTPRLIRSRLHAVVIYLPEHSACIEQMLKQFPSCFKA